MNYQWFGQMGPWPLFGLGGVFFFILLAWSLYWKGMALWKAARVGSQGWFIALLIVNTMGILDILYIYVFSKKQNGTMMMEPPKTPPAGM